MYAIIMAGGEGKRFWPMSRKDKPKQFLSLIGGRSMIRRTVDRILPLIPIDNVLVVTLEQYADETLTHIPELPKDNLILEPEGKNTAPAIALGTLKIKKRNPDAVTVVFPADHAIGNEDTFREVLVFAHKVANTRLKDDDFPLVTLGVKPIRPETGYGYIKEGEVVKSSKKYEVKRVANFTEKPDLKTASGFFEDGRYYWNSGIFVWKASSILREFSRFLPVWRECFDNIFHNLGSPRENEAVLEFYGQIDGGPIDKLILEKSKNTLVIPVDFSWSDIGNWQTLDEFLRTNSEENVSYGEVINIDSSSCLVYGGGKKLIALVGVKDLVVVDTEDAILILEKHRDQDVRKVVEILEKRQGE